MNLKRIVRKRLGELLVSEGFATTDQIQEALAEQKQTGELLGELLVGKGYVSEMDIAQALCSHFQLPFLQPAQYDIPKEILGVMPANFLHEYQILPLDRFENMISFCMSGLISRDAVEEIQTTTGCEIAIFIGTISDVRSTLRKQIPYGFDVDRSTKRITKKVKKEEPEDEGGKSKASGGRKMSMDKDYLMVRISKSVSRDEVEEPATSPVASGSDEEVDPNMKVVNIEVTGEAEDHEGGLFQEEEESGLGAEWMDMFDQADSAIESEIKEQTGEVSREDLEEEGGDDWGAMFDEADQEIQETSVEGQSQETAPSSEGEGEGWENMFDEADQQVQQEPQAEAGPPSPSPAPSPAPAPADSESSEGAEGAEGGENWGSMFDEADAEVIKEAGLDVPSSSEPAPAEDETGETPPAPSPAPAPAPADSESSEGAEGAEGGENWGSMFDEADAEVIKEAGFDVTPPAPEEEGEEEEEREEESPPKTPPTSSQEESPVEPEAEPMEPVGEESESSEGGDDWGSMFDEADEEVKKEAGFDGVYENYESEGSSDKEKEQD